MQRGVREHLRGAGGEIGERAAAGVGQDDLAPSIPPHDARHGHVDARPHRLVGVVNHRQRQVGVDGARVGGVGRLHEDDGPLRVEPAPERFKGPPWPRYWWPAP